MKLRLPKALFCAVMAACAASYMAHAETTTSSESLTLGDVMYVGDSITHGYGEASYRWALHKILVDNSVIYNEVGYTSNNSGGDLAGESYRGVTFENVHSAWSGQRAYETAGRNNKSGYLNGTNIQNWLGISDTTNKNTTYTGEVYNPDTFVLLLGTNDLLSDSYSGGLSANLETVTETLLGDMKTIIDTMYQSNQAATVIVSTIPCWTAHKNNTDADTHQAVATYNESFKAWVADYNAANNTDIVLVDVNRGIIDVASSTPFYGVENMFTYPGTDGLHPGPQGELIIAGNMARAMGIGGRTAGANRIAAADFSQVTYNTLTEGVSNFNLSSDTPSLTYTWSDTPTGGYTAELMGFTFGNGALNEWNTTDDFAFTIGNGSGYGTLLINEAYIKWGDTILFSYDMSTLTENIRMAYVVGDDSQGIGSGYYVWLGDMLIGEALTATGTDNATNGVTLSYSGSSYYTLQGVALDSTGTYAPTIGLFNTAADGSVVVPANVNWTTAVVDTNSTIYANTTSTDGDVWCKVTSGKATSWTGANGTDGAAVDGNIVMIFADNYEGGSTAFGAVKAGSGVVDGDITLQFDAENATYGSFSSTNAASVQGAFQSSISGTFRAIINAGTFNEDIVGGIYNGNSWNGSGYSIGSTEIVINGGTFAKDSDIYGGGGGGTINGDTSVNINGGTIAGNIYGGGKGDTIKGNTSVTISGNTAVLGGTVISGGGTSGTIEGNSTVTIKDVSASTISTLAAEDSTDETAQTTIATYSGTLTGGSNVSGTSALVIENAQLTGSATVTEFDNITLTDGSNVALGDTSLTGTTSEVSLAGASTLSINGTFTTEGALNITGGNGAMVLSGTTNTINGALSIADGNTLSLGSGVKLLLNTTLSSAPLTQYPDTTAPIDWSGITSASGSTLSVTAGGTSTEASTSSSNDNQGPTVSAITLGENFTGKLEILGGKMSASKSDFGNAGAIVLNGGGLLYSELGTAFATHEVTHNWEIGTNGGYIDHYGSSDAAMKDVGSSTHTGSISGSGTLTFIGYGEWVLKGDYSKFNGSIQYGNQAQCLYIGSDMTGLKNLLNNTSYGTAQVVVGYKATNGVTVSVSTNEKIENNNKILLTNGSTFNHNGGVSIASGKTLTVTGYATGSTGTYNVSDISFTNSSSTLSVGAGIKANITNTTESEAANGNIAIASGATVNDSRQLTITGAYTISGEGEYNQTGSLTVNEGAALTLGGSQVTLAALTNNGTLTLADTLSSLKISDFAIGTEYAIGTVTDGKSKNWKSLLGYNTVNYEISYVDGMLTSSYNLVAWVSGADDDITWGGADNWKIGDTYVTPDSTTDVLLPTNSDDVSATIEIAANTAVAAIDLQGQYALTVADGASYSFDFSSINIAENAGLSKTGSGTLSMSLEDATAAAMHITEGTLTISGTLANTVNSGTILDGATNSGNWRESGLYTDLSRLSAESGATLQVTLAGSMGSGNDSTRLVLGDDFAGSLEVLSGQLGHSSNLGNASSVILSNAGLVFNNDADAGNDASTAFNTPIVIKGNGSLRAWGAYATNAAVVAEVSGDSTATLLKHDSGIIRVEEFSGFAGNVNVVGGKLILADNSETTSVGAVTIGDEATLTYSGTATHKATSINMAAATTTLVVDTDTKLTVGSITGDENADTETINITLQDGAQLTLTSTDQLRTIGSTVNISLGDGVVLTDAAVRRLGNSSLSITGNGVYKVAGLQLSNGADGQTNVSIGSGATLHITGTTNTSTSHGGSLLTGTNSAGNVITVNGTLALECGISHWGSDTKSNTITVANGGTLAFNKGLTASNTRTDSVQDVININAGGMLELSSTNNTGANKLTINLANNAIVMAGNAHDTTAATLPATVTFSGKGIYAGAKVGSTLTLKSVKESGWIHILGTNSTTAENRQVQAGGTVVLDVENLTLNSLNIDQGGTAQITGTATLYLNQWGGLGIAGTLQFDGAGTITLGKAISNTGSVELLNTDNTVFVLSDALKTKDSQYNQTWVLVENNGELTGWDTLTTANFSLNGSELTRGDWDKLVIENGFVSLRMLYAFWDSVGDESTVWDTENGTVWRDADGEDEQVYEAGSRVVFGDADDDDESITLNKSVTVDKEGVDVRRIVIEGSDYNFSGGDIRVTEYVQADNNATLSSDLILNGGDTAVEINVAENATLSVGELKTAYTTSTDNVVSYSEGSFTKTGSGTLSVTQGIYGTITSATVSEGSMSLGDTVKLSIGDNKITGGSIANAMLEAEGSVTDGLSGNTVAAPNVIKSADGTNPAILSGVKLAAGSAVTYASLQGVCFEGDSSLSGYITYESTRRSNDIYVATGSTLTLSGVTFDLHGLGAGTKVLIENSAVSGASDAYSGTLSDWDTAQFIYSGISINPLAINTETAGVVTLNTEHSGNLYWDGSSNAWDGASANWSSTEGTDGEEVFTALSNVYFGTTPDNAAKSITATQDVVAMHLYLTQGGYSFTGSRIATLGNMQLAPQDGDLSIANQLVAQGDLSVSGSGTINLGGQIGAAGSISFTSNGAVTLGSNVSAGGDFCIGTEDTPVTDKADGSTLYTLSGSVSAQNILIHLAASAENSADDTVHLVADGAITATGDTDTTAADGSIRLLGSAGKTFNNSITAGRIYIDSQHEELNNTITFNGIVNADTLEIAADSHVRISNTGSDINNVLLGGTLYMDTLNVTYNKVSNIYSTNDAAVLVLGSISTNEFALISGLSPAEQADTVADAEQYNSISINANTRYLTANALADLKDLTLYNGPLTVKSGEGAIHGNLNITDAGGLSLTDTANNIMAAGSGKITVDHGTLNLNNTTQTLRSSNVLELSTASISGNAAGSGLVFSDTTGSICYTGRNTISANINVVDGTTLTVTPGIQPEDLLTISGNISGAGNINLNGDGTVQLTTANDFAGTLTLGDESRLSITDTNALQNAALVLLDGSSLYIEAGNGNIPYNISSLQIGNGTDAAGSVATLQISNLAGTDGVSVADTALHLGALTANSNITLNLQLAFAEGGLENMKTYNLFSSETAISLDTLNISLSVIANDVANQVAAGQYQVGYDAVNKIVYLHTMLGNIWSGGAQLDGESYAGDGIWAVGNTDGNWSGKDYDETGTYKNAIFVDLTGSENATVSIDGTVAPGDIYFEANSTYYKLKAEGENRLATGTNIHKAGSATVHLSLAGNTGMDNAVGNIDLQSGELYLDTNLAMGGTATISSTASLHAHYAGLVTENYFAKGVFSNLSMTQDAIFGESADNKGTITSKPVVDGNVATIAGNENSSVLLQYVTLASYTGAELDSLSNVTIGAGVDVTGVYTLNGTITLQHSLSNSGTVTYGNGVIFEIAQLSGTPVVSTDDSTSYDTYQLVSGGTINGYDSITADNITVRGVNLSTGLVDGITATATATEGGALNISFTGATLAVPVWDTDWQKDAKAPALTKRYTGTDATATIAFNTADYTYGSVVKEGGNTIAATLSSAATGSLAAGGNGADYAAQEKWIYDRSAIGTVIAGIYNGGDGVVQTGDTHLAVNADTANQKTWVIGGSYGTQQQAHSYLTILNGSVVTAVGGSYGAAQTGTAYVFVDGGTVSEIFAGSYNAAITAAEGSTYATQLSITGGTLGSKTDSARKRVYGGAYNGAVNGDIVVTVNGDATITDLVGGNYGGSVTGNITLNLIKGTVYNDINAAGIGSTTVNGYVTVNLYQDFSIAGNANGGLYGGKETGSGVSSFTGTSTLHFAEAGEYVFATWSDSSSDGVDSGANKTSSSYITIKGFDVISLAEGAVVTVDTKYFDRDPQTGAGALQISGKGIVQLGGEYDYSRRDIRLTDGATLKIISSYTAKNHSATYDNQTGIYITDGTTFDISGYPRENGTDDGGGSLSYRLYLSGDGVDGMGALYKGATTGDYSTNPTGKASLGYIELQDNASVATYANIPQIGAGFIRTVLDLNNYTFTKRGDAAYVLCNTDISAGSLYVQEGTLSMQGVVKGANTDVVLTTGTTLSGVLNGGATAHIRSLSGEGNVELSNFHLYLTPQSDGKFYGEFIDESNSYNNLMSGTGYAYGVYSGNISGEGYLHIGDDTNYGEHTGVQYLSGADSTYSGGTHMESGRLYLLSSTVGSIEKGSTTVTAGPIGTGTLYWDAAENAELYLGNGVTVYNAGSTYVTDSDASMIIGVEGAPNGDALSNYAGIHGTVEKDGTTYYEVDTHNLYSISCNGIYADGTAYAAGTEIDRNKMLLVTESAWNDASSTVKGFSDTGYNEATYSGVLSGDAALQKVGAGTLVIDQANAYTGGTRIYAGTLKLKGWAQIGSAADGSIDVSQTAGSTLMLAYDGSYTDEITGIANNITLQGTGDVRWEGSEETGGATAALISDVGAAVTFTMSGTISGSGNLLHSGEGTLVLSGESDFTGGAHATRGTVEVQSAAGLGATANGSNVVTIEAEADLKVTVKDGAQAGRISTGLAAANTKIAGDVTVQGTDTTERVLHMAVNGYDNATTTLGTNGTLLLNGSGISAETDTLTGDGKVVVSDASGAGATVNIAAMVDYTGDFRAEGSGASINAAAGNFKGGSIEVSGKSASVNTQGAITITSGNHLALTSTGTGTNAAVVSTTGGVVVSAQARLAVSLADTDYEYNLQQLKESTSLSVASLYATATAGVETYKYHAIGAAQTADIEAYSGSYDTALAVNQQAAGAVNAEEGLQLYGGATYSTSMANLSLMGGDLTLDTNLESLITLETETAMDYAALARSNPDTQLVLFSDVGSVYFGTDGITVDADSGVYYALANQYFTGNPYIGDETLLVYDSYAKIVYLDRTIPEPTTATLSLLALAALAARRRRR